MQRKQDACVLIQELKAAHKEELDQVQQEKAMHKEELIKVQQDLAIAATTVLVYRRRADDTRISEVLQSFGRNVPVPEHELIRAIGERLGTLDTRSESSTWDRDIRTQLRQMGVELRNGMYSIGHNFCYSRLHCLACASH